MTEKEIIASDLMDICEILNNNGYGAWSKSIYRAINLLNEQGKALKQWETAAGFLEAHGWKWNGE